MALTIASTRVDFQRAAWSIDQYRACDHIKQIIAARGVRGLIADPAKCTDQGEHVVARHVPVRCSHFLRARQEARAGTAKVGTGRVEG